MTLKPQNLLFLLFLSYYSVFSQTFEFENYTTIDGIAQDFIYDINQDTKGYLWIATGDGLSKFDGKNFTTYTSQNNLKENVITSSHIDKKGHAWFGHLEGGVTKRIDDKFIPLNSPKKLESQIVAFDSYKNNVFFISQNEGLYSIVNDSILYVGNFNIDNITSILVLNELNILLGSYNGLHHLQLVNQKWELKNTILKNNEVVALKHSKNRNLIALMNGEILTIKIKNGALKTHTLIKAGIIKDVVIKSIIEDKNSNIWVATGSNGLLKIQLNNDNTTTLVKYNEKTGLKSNYLQCVFEDFEGNIWTGGFGSGISRLTDDFFTFYKNRQSNVHAIFTENNNIWYGTDNGFELKTTGLLDTTYWFNSNNGFIDDKVTSLYKADNVLWIGTAKNGVYSYNTINKKFNKIEFNYSSLHQHINQLIVKDKAVWIATNGGLIIYNINNKANTLLTTEDGLAHNSIKSIYISDDRTIYLGTHSQFLYSIKNGQINEIKLIENSEIEIIDITENTIGTVIIATAENGIFTVNKNKQVNHYTENEGLMSNYTYAIEVDMNNNIWIGHRNGISKYKTKDSTFYTYGKESGIEGQINYGAIYRDTKNNIWFGKDNGLISYNPKSDKSFFMPPSIAIKSIKINDVNYPTNKTINLPYGKYRIEIEFIGISFKNANQIKYKTFLKGFDEVYSNKTKENTKTYSKLIDGNYEFRVKAFNNYTKTIKNYASVKINISAPFWKTWWFYTLCFLALIGLLIVLDRIRSRRLRLAKESLERKLKFKTKEVVEKAKKIEEINIDLTASINYAKRIQSATLPTPGYLNQFLPKSFIFFKPRDIVSGDFYFIRKIGDKLIVACVDCTGHGVPGAFMSMIGSVTLRNIYKTMQVAGEWKTPEKVLEILDHEIEIILKQKSNIKQNKYDRSRDGMDLTLIEIDLTNNIILFSSAKRQVILKTNNEIQVVSGTKRSIGGGDDNIFDFELNSIKMHTGDAMYLFTDGFPDQFGGEFRKKLKVSGVKKMTQELTNIVQDKHYAYVESTFENWQKDNFQIDDVLFIGIEF